MQNPEHFSRGMGIDGWLTNYKRTALLPEEQRGVITTGDREHFATYITREDIQRIAYTFHFYDPKEFTHQRGILQETQHLYNREMPYPCDIERYKDYRRFTGADPAELDRYPEMGEQYLRDRLQPAADFRIAHPDKTLYCGEFGTIRHCRIEWRENWFRDVTAFCREYDIPFCIWNYLSTPYDGNRFSLVEDDFRQPLSREIIKIINGRKG